MVLQVDFTGTWKLIRGESDFGFLPPPRLRVDTIAQEGARIRIATRQKDASGTASVVRDLEIGGEAAEVLVHGKPRRVSARWEGEELVVETRFEVSGRERILEDRWSLDPSRDWITVVRRHELPGGVVTQRLRLRRQTEERLERPPLRIP